MSKTIFSLFAVLSLCVTAIAQDDSYYKAIQKGSTTQIKPADFKKMEEKAKKDFSNPDSYEQLANAFGNSTEKVWAVIYGEVYCNLSTDPERSKQIGALVFQWYENAFSKNGNDLSISLTKNTQTAKLIPFETQFELSFLMGSLGMKDGPIPMTIQKLISIRKNQLSQWDQKKLPQTGLERYQKAILTAGHFDAYNYWLFQGIHPQEFNEWLQIHQAQYKDWLDWQNKNKFTVQSPDFQRLTLMH